MFITEIATFVLVGLVAFTLLSGTIGMFMKD